MVFIIDVAIHEKRVFSPRWFKLSPGRFLIPLCSIRNDLSPCERKGE